MLIKFNKIFKIDDPVSVMIHIVVTFTGSFDQRVDLAVAKMPVFQLHKGNACRYMWGSHRCAAVPGVFVIRDRAADRYSRRNYHN